MILCGRCIERTSFIASNAPRLGFSRRVLVSRSSSSLSRASLSFFSTNTGLAADASLPHPVERQGSLARWGKATRDAAGIRNNAEALQKDIPIEAFIPQKPSLPAPYPPPLPLSAYKPIPILTPSRLLRIYSQLSKTRLTSLIVLTAMAGVAISPLPASVPVLLSTAFGTALCCASANTINQLFEVPFDAQMARTRNRPLVRRAISPLHAASFAAVTGIAGPAILLACVNPLTAILGALNIVLYAGVYTLMKRRTIWNTWVGAIVGGIPPVMGWTACGGQILPSSTYPIETFLPPFLLTTPPLPIEAIDNPLSALALFAFLFSWQFPHFNALSHLIRASYAQAGYHMLSVLSPSKNALVSLRHAALFIPICSVLVPLSGLTTWAFALTSLVPNLIILRGAWQFWRKGTDKTARVVWHHSLWYLPLVLGLMMFHKQGMEWLQWIGWSKKEAEVVEQ